MPDGFTVHDVEMVRTGGSYGTVEGADVTVCDGVTLHFATLNEHGEGWGIWGVTIDDRMYFEPRDLTPVPLGAGPWQELLIAAVKRTGGRTTAPTTTGRPDA